MTYVLDTNIVIWYLRESPDVLKRFRNAVINGDMIVIPEPVHYEVKRGFHIQSAFKKERLYNELISPFGFSRVTKFNSKCWECAEYVYEELYRKKITIGELDIFIAAFCIEKDYTLVTNNIKHFVNINGLTCENWVS